MAMMIKPISLMMSCSLVIGSASLPAQQGLMRNRGKEVQEHVRPLLKSSNFARLDWNRHIAWRADKYGNVQLPDELVEHHGGIFGIKHVVSTVYSNSPLEAGVYGQSEIRVLARGASLMDENIARTIASNFLSAAFPWFFAMGPNPILTVARPGADGLWSFEWMQLTRDELPVATAHAKIRAVDGRVVQFSAVRIAGSWSARKISSSQAKQAALQHILKTQANIPRENIRILKVVLSSMSEDLSVYDVEFEVGHDIEDKTSGKLQINAACGKYVDSSFVLRPQRKNSTILVNDTKPIWTKAGLAFISNRSLHGLPSWAVSPPQLYIADSPDHIRYMTEDLSNPIQDLSGLPNSEWLTVMKRGWIYGVNIHNASYHILSQPDRRSAIPAINVTGDWAMLSGWGRTGNSDMDLLPANMQEKNKLILLGRLVYPDGHEQSPLFSMDDKWLYFVTTRGKNGKLLHALCRISVKLALMPGIKQINDTVVETVIPDVGGSVQRLSFFPNGEKILLQLVEGIGLVDLPNRKLIKVAFNNLRDRELEMAPISSVSDAWAGPGNDRVTFSGETTDQQGRTRRRIYSCLFTGDDLKSHTSKENVPAQAYQFPGAEKTVFDLAKEWALNEVRYEDKKRM